MSWGESCCVSKFCVTLSAQRSLPSCCCLLRPNRPPTREEGPERPRSCNDLREARRQSQRERQRLRGHLIERLYVYQATSQQFVHPREHHRRRSKGASRGIGHDRGCVVDGVAAGSKSGRLHLKGCALKVTQNFAHTA